ncbi:MAG TPA: divalent cation tolerance protein CutA [Candidatus Nanoarchaeia archaeon]|nr:divalent cation tolerance protein CutA [Candidatus Nanoarchaeia archaeon]
MLTVYCTCKDTNEAQKIARLLLDKKLIVCANMLPINSMFLWEKKICETTETLLLLKTKESNFKKIQTEITKIHSYNVPFIGAFPEQTTPDIERWLKEELE